MSCDTKGLSRRKKITLFSSLGAGIAGVSYLTFTTTSNPAIAATVPALLSVAACPVMCVAMGGVMWFMNKFSKNKNKDNHMVSTSNRAEKQEKEKGEGSCCGFPQINKNIQNAEHKHSYSSKDNGDAIQPPSLRPQKHKINQNQN